MKLNVRFALLISALLAALIGSILLLNAAHESQTKRSVDTLVREQSRQLDQLLLLTGYPLQQFARDYSLWDDMVTFVSDPKPDWAKVNIDSSIDTFHLAGAWVVNETGELIYGAARAPLPTDGKLPVPPKALMEELRQTRFPHFFQKVGTELLEFQASPIQPSGDTLRTSSAKGWLIAAKLWDDRALQSLAEVTRAQISLEGTDTPKVTASTVGSVEMGRALPGLDHRPIARLRLHFEPEELVNLQAYGHQVLGILILQGLVTIVVTVLGVHFWVVRPFQKITESLSTQDPTPVKQIAESKTELGHIARLVGEHFEAVSALKRSKESLDRALEERVRLGRDLHDGVIQAIYAAGMGLAATRETIRTDPAAAQRKLDEIRNLLNETIREVRGFIVRLELDDLEEKSFRQTIEDIAKRLAAGQAIELTIDVDNELAERLPIDVKTHALESIRDILRSGLLDRHATRFTVTLSLRHNSPTLLISDNGRASAGARPSITSPTGPDGLTSFETFPGGTRATITYSLS
ncbi:hypothetical protein DB347_12725 [Opitutaceae bacterium EW11]|nr:hypothetical protein DB347_12725 [Opitutaceae bacterium EW11]